MALAPQSPDAKPAVGAATDDNASPLRWINHVIVGEYVVDQSARRWVSLALLLTAVLIGIATYRSTGWFTRDVSLRPDLFSGIIAILLVLPLYLRRVLKFGNTFYCYLSLSLNAITLAILVQALLGQASWFGALPMPYLIGFAIMMTWTGMRPVALVVWALVLLMGIINIQSASDAMGLWGFAFIWCVALGVVLQIDYDARRFLSELRHDFGGAFVGGDSPALPLENKKHSVLRKRGQE